MAATTPAPARLADKDIGSLSIDYGIEKTGFWLSVGTLVTMAVVMGALLITLPRQTPVPSLTSTTSAQQIEQWSSWMKMQTDYATGAVDRTVKIGQLFITGTLLPVLTALLGYIFGKREDEPSNNE